MAVPLLSGAAPTRRLIADKAYDADSLRHWLADQRIKAVIPSTASRRTPYPLDRPIYRRRNVIERLFCRLKNWRRPKARTPTANEPTAPMPVQAMYAALSGNERMAVDRSAKLPAIAASMTTPVVTERRPPAFMATAHTVSSKPARTMYTQATAAAS